MESLPFIDVHSQRFRGSPEAAWAALLTVLRRTMGGSRRFARLLGCDPAQATPSFEGRIGDAVPGFRVVESKPSRRLALRGRHRFADYALTFTIDADHIHAQSHAEFPGLLGKAYRTAVIGTRAHRIITRGMLRMIARAAART